MSGSAKRSHFNPRLVGFLTPTHFTTAIADPERLLGCLAMTDGKIAENCTVTGTALEAGQPCFHIFPFRMNGWGWHAACVSDRRYRQGA